MISTLNSVCSDSIFATLVHRVVRVWSLLSVYLRGSGSTSLTSPSRVLLNSAGCSAPGVLSLVF